MTVWRGWIAPPPVPSISVRIGLIGKCDVSMPPPPMVLIPMSDDGRPLAGLMKKSGVPDCARIRAHVADPDESRCLGLTRFRGRLAGATTSAPLIARRGATGKGDRGQTGIITPLGLSLLVASDVHSHLSTACLSICLRH